MMEGLELEILGLVSGLDLGGGLGGDLNDGISISSVFGICFNGNTHSGGALVDQTAVVESGAVLEFETAFDRNRVGIGHTYNIE
jgi:hypothetical protein